LQCHFIDDSGRERLGRDFFELQNNTLIINFNFMSHTTKEEKTHEIPRKNWEDPSQYDTVNERRLWGTSERIRRKCSKLWSRLTAKIGRRISKKKIEESLLDMGNSIPPPVNSDVD
jgi:hypothetical protein